MNTPSILGQSFVDANFILTGAGLLLNTTNNNPGNSAKLVLQGASGANPMLTADTTFVTADGLDRVDSNARLLAAPYVIIQTPGPGVGVNVGISPSTSTAIGYQVPTALGPPIAVP